MCTPCQFRVVKERLLPKSSQMPAASLLLRLHAQPASVSTIDKHTIFSGFDDMQLDGRATSVCKLTLNQCQAEAVLALESKNVMTNADLCMHYVNLYIRRVQTTRTLTQQICHCC